MLNIKKVHRMINEAIREKEPRIAEVGWGVTNNVSALVVFDNAEGECCPMGAFALGNAGYFSEVCTEGLSITSEELYEFIAGFDEDLCSCKLDEEDRPLTPMNLLGREFRIQYVHGGIDPHPDCSLV